MKRPFFSAVIDNYNYGRFIGQAIDSILAQDFPAGEIEIVVVDDGSTDDSRDVVLLYKDKVTLIRQENQGQAAAMNTGLLAAQGEVSCLMDSDDYWHPEKLKEVAKALEDPKVGIVQHYQRDVDIDGVELNNQLPDWPPKFNFKDFLGERFDYGATSSLALRRGILEKILPMPKDIFYFTDVYLVDFGMLHTEMVNVRRVLGYHRIHGANNWAQMYINPKKLEGSIREARAYRGYLEPKLKERGLPFTHHCFALQELEILRREILLDMYMGDRQAAFRSWKRMLREGGNSPFGLFRCATCLLALVSPRLYLGFYDLYSSAGWLGRMRARLLPRK